MVSGAPRAFCFFRSVEWVNLHPAVLCQPDALLICQRADSVEPDAGLCKLSSLTSLLSFGTYSSEALLWLCNFVAFTGQTTGVVKWIAGRQTCVDFLSQERCLCIYYSSKKCLFGFGLPWSYEKSHCLQGPAASSSAAYQALHEGTSPHCFEPATW